MTKIKTIIWSSIFAVTLVISLHVDCQQLIKSSDGNKTVSKLKAELTAINRSIEDCYLKQNADCLVPFYNKGFTYLPEYKQPIYKTNDLQQFYADWFKAVHIDSYHKTIYGVENIAGYVLEIGNFSLSYKKELGAENYYTGKYLTMWKRDISGKLTIVSEAFGSDKYINMEDIPYATVEVKESRVSDENIVSQKLRPALEEFDKSTVQAVLTGDGDARANGFTRDGIYMPHFDPMQVGMDMIRPYMLKTYAPGRISYVKDTFCEIFDSGDFVFLSGHFKVTGSNNTTFEGNMSNLMKRNKNGKLLMYRQLAHN